MGHISDINRAEDERTGDHDVYGGPVWRFVWTFHVDIGTPFRLSYSFSPGSPGPNSAREFEIKLDQRYRVPQGPEIWNGFTGCRGVNGSAIDQNPQIVVFTSNYILARMKMKIGATWYKNLAGDSSVISENEMQMSFGEGAALCSLNIKAVTALENETNEMYIQTGND